MNWPMKPLSELCLLAVDCVNKTAPVVEGPTPFKMIRTTNVKRGFIDTTTVRYVSEATYEQWTRRSRPLFGDVILTREAPVGEVGRCTFDESEQIFLGQRLFQYRPDPALLDWNYLAYALQSPQVQNTLHGMSFGATVPHIKVGDAEHLEIPCPPLVTQQAIGELLAAYDDLIEINRRRMALIDEAASLLYQDWFVNLRFPGHEQPGDLCRKGWVQQPVGDWLEYFIGGGWGEEAPAAGAIDEAYVIRGTDIAKIRKGEFEAVPLRFHPEKNLSSRRLQSGDLVFEVSGGSRDQGVGKLLHISEELLSAFDRPVMCASFCKLIRPKRHLGLILAQALEHMREDSTLRVFENQSASNIVNFAFSDFIVRQLIWTPPCEIIDAFNEKISPLFRMRHVLSVMLSDLKSARDELLPRLVSGGIQV